MKNNWDEAIEESQRKDVEWSLNEDRFCEHVPNSKLTKFEKVVGWTLAGCVFVLLAPIALPTYLFVSYLDKKYDITCS